MTSRIAIPRTKSSWTTLDEAFVVGGAEIVTVAMPIGPEDGPLLQKVIADAA
jgi:hypothetical protein